MKIGIDIHVLDGMHQGSRRYLECLYKEVLGQPSRHDWVFFLGSLANRPNDWPSNTSFKEFGTSSSFLRLAGLANYKAREEQISCMHYQYLGPFFYGCNEALTIHDILFESYPNLFPSSARWFLGPLIRRSAERAKIIFTVSEFTRQELIERYAIPAHKIVLTPNGVDRSAFNPDDRDLSIQLLEKAYGIKDYILVVGRLEPRKNHLGLLRAYADLKARRRDIPRMVFLGARDFGAKLVTKAIQDMGLENHVLLISHISDGELAHFYRAALLMAYPSFAEGFGLPPLEAMACGCPVLTSRTTALAEVVQGCGWGIDPYDSESISQGLENALQSPSERDRQRSAGLKIAAKFTWKHSARALIQAFDQLEACP